MNHITILDFGSQYTHLIAKRIRELNVLAKIYTPDTPLSAYAKNSIGFIFSGGPVSVYEKNALSINLKLFKLKKPILGICYGHQLIAHLLGGEVKPGKRAEYGPARLNLLSSSLITRSINKSSRIWMSHCDSVELLPENFKMIGKSKNCSIAVMANEYKKIYGLQFHPEVDHTEYGQTILKNFVVSICGAEQNWKVSNIIKQLLKNIRAVVGKRSVFMLVSGGVDSNVAFALLNKALGKKRVKGLYINTGFMRLNETNEIINNYKRCGLDNIIAVDASKTFYKNLKNIYGPETKRNIIGRTFLKVRAQIAREYKLNLREWILGQGTIYPDTIESSGTKHADKIKTHHNRVDEIEKLIKKGLVVEPLVDFYKFEVRAIGRLLKLPPKMIKRHPFPGPGLAIRCLCRKETKFPVGNLVSSAKKLKKKFPGIEISPLPVKTVGVQGDNRTYARALAVWNESSWDKLDRFTVYTTNAYREINRVLLLLNPPIGNKLKFHKPATNLYLTPKRIELLQQIDNIVHKIIKKYGWYDKIWQFPVVLIPVCDNAGRESIVLRPVDTRDVMTLNFIRLSKKILKEMTAAILATNKISYIFYDTSNKPPATLEWE